MMDQVHAGAFLNYMRTLADKHNVVLYGDEDGIHLSTKTGEYLGDYSWNSNKIYKTRM